MQASCFLVALFFVPFVAADVPADVKTELEKLQGTWRLVKETDDGKEMSAEDARKTKLTFDADGKWRVEFDGKVVGEGTLTLDPGKRPKTIDYTFTGGQDKGKVFKAIYELDGDSFKHCGVLTGPRPDEFTAKAGSGRSLTVFRRTDKP